MKTISHLTYLALLLLLPLLGLAETSPTPNVTECAETFLSIFPDCISNRQPPQTPAELLQSDLRVCQCIDDSPLLRAAQEAVPESAVNSTKKMVTEALGLEQDHATGLALSGIQLADSQEMADKVIIANTGSGTKNKLAGLRANLDPASTELATIDDRVLEVNVIPADSEASQCVTFNEYNAMRILPQSSSFYRDLQRSEFRQEDWDINALALRYDQATDPAIKSGIVERINFLQRNTQLRYIFLARPAGAITAEQVLERQRGVYNSLRLLLPPEGSTCFETSRCGAEAISEGRYLAFNDQLREFFRMDSVLDDMTNAAQARDIEGQIRSLMDSPEGHGEENLDEYFYRLQNQSGDIVRRCSSANADASCYPEFRNHCKSLRRIQRRLEQNVRLNGNDVLRRIQQQDRSETNLDLSENLSFQQFNDRMCLQVFRNADGEELSYFGFQNKYCTGASPLPECGDRRALLSRYLREYTGGEGTEVLSSRAAFADLIKNQNFVDISSGALEAANRLDETPAQLRERFGGLYPRVGANGELLPPLPQSGGASTASSTSRPETPVGPGSSSGVVTPVSARSPRENPFSSASTARAREPARSPGSASSSTAPAWASPLTPASGASSGFSQRPLSPPVQPSVPEFIDESSPTKTFTQSAPSTPSTPTATQSPVALAPAAREVQAAPVAATAAPASSSTRSTPPPVRSREDFSRIDFGNRALMDIYQSSEDMQFLPIVDFRNLDLRRESLERYQDNLQLLAKNADVVNMVNASDRIVELTVQGKNGEEIVVFAKREGESIVIYESLYGATRTKNPARGVASASADFRVHVKAKTYETFKNQPNGILLDSSVYERILYSDSDDFRIYLTSDTHPQLTLRVRKQDGNITVVAE